MTNQAKAYTMSRAETSALKTANKWLTKIHKISLAGDKAMKAGKWNTAKRKYNELVKLHSKLENYINYIPSFVSKTCNNNRDVSTALNIYFEAEYKRIKDVASLLNVHGLPTFRNMLVHAGQL